MLWYLWSGPEIFLLKFRSLAVHSRGDQPVEKFIHHITPQRHTAADGHVLAQLEIGDAVPRLADNRLATSEQRQILRRVFNRVFLQRRADAHIHHDLLQLRNLVNVRVVVLLLQRGHHFVFVFFVKSGFHFSGSRIWP